MAASIASGQVTTIIVACEAGMGSSVMSVNALKKKLKAANLDARVKVQHKPAREVAADAQIVVVHRGLADVVRKRAPNAVVIAFEHFLKDPAFDTLVQSLASGDLVMEHR
jgi:mannitol-specific phosphotransferase system IIBC component